jgi:hypothetical protein
MKKPKFLCLTIIAIAFVATLAAVLSTTQPIGADYYFHLEAATFYAHGQFSAGINFVLNFINFPYGFHVSLFHLFLVPLVWVGQPYLFTRILQVLFLPLTLALTMWLVYRFGNPMAAVYSGMALLGSWAFFDGALQVRPESLDLLFYPLIVAAALTGQKLRFVGLAVITVYSHGIAALSNIYGLALKKLKEKSWQKTVVVAALVVLPVLAVSVAYVGGAFKQWGGYGLTENPQEHLFWTAPVGFIPYYMGATILGIPFLFRRVKSEFEQLILWGLAGVTIMLPFWADRYLHYVSLPLAIYAGLGIVGLKGRWKLIAVLVLLDIFIVYVASFFSFSFGIGGRWWQPGD